MEWVETTGKTVEAAKESALDQLGVAEDDAEFEIVAEPRSGLFGFLRGEARVRARVRPTRPRPKVDRRDRRRRRDRDRDRESADRESAEPPSTERGPASEGSRPAGPGGQSTARSNRSADRRRPRRRGGGDGQARPRVEDGPKPTTPDRSGPPQEETNVAAELSPKDQAGVVAEFLEGMLGAFGLDGSLSEVVIDEETIEVRIEGDDLGILIGPRGQTLQAVQELGRAAVQRRLAGGREARVRVDVAGYRQRRREALERFARGVAEDVRDSGVTKALEPMSPPDRKVVHDTVNQIAGVGTVSEGEEPNRRVVIVPRSTQPLEDGDVAAPDTAGEAPVESGDEVPGPLGSGDDVTAPVHNDDDVEPPVTHAQEPVGADVAGDGDGEQG
jgi:spoIIIJ-associated protein